jgi:hypothetical protein
VCLWLGSASAAAQSLPSGPLVIADGHVALGADVSATYGSSDPGFFDYTDYQHSALRLLRVDISGTVKGGEHFAILGEVRTEIGLEKTLDVSQPQAGTRLPVSAAVYALYLRARPWRGRNFDIQAGRIPPTFGGFARRTYPSDNPLIGYPLAYQYLTSLRPDAVPASAEELLRRRGTGWLTGYSIGNAAADRGVPLVSAFRWDTGVQVHGGSDLITGTASISAGTLANPLVSDDNSRPQVAGRLELRPVAGLIIGTSAARGPFVTETAARSAVGDGHDREFTQQAFGADIEYSWDYYVLRFEAIVNDWRLPVVRAPELRLPLRAVSTSVEGRYRIVPGLYAAARFDHLGFSTITGSPEQGALPWDAPTTRVEIGGGWSVQRNLVFKVSYQHNVRDGGRLLRKDGLGAAQVVFWF